MSILNEKRYNEKDAAILIGISKMTLMRHRTAGNIRHYKVGNRILYGESHLEDFLSGSQAGGTSDKVQNLDTERTL